MWQGRPAGRTRRSTVWDRFVARPAGWSDFIKGAPETAVGEAFPLVFKGFDKNVCPVVSDCYKLTFTFLHFYIFTLLHFYTITFLHFYIFALLHFYTFTFLQIYWWTPPSSKTVNL